MKNVYFQIFANLISLSYYINCGLFVDYIYNVTCKHSSMHWETDSPQNFRNWSIGYSTDCTRRFWKYVGKVNLNWLDFFHFVFYTLHFSFRLNRLWWNLSLLFLSQPRTNKQIFYLSNSIREFFFRLEKVNYCS